MCELVISIVLPLLRFTRSTATIIHIVLKMKNRTTAASRNHGQRYRRLGVSGLSPSIMACAGDRDRLSALPAFEIPYASLRT